MSFGVKFKLIEINFIQKRLLKYQTLLNQHGAFSVSAKHLSLIEQILNQFRISYKGQNGNLYVEQIAAADLLAVMLFANVWLVVR